MFRFFKSLKSQAIAGVAATAAVVTVCVNSPDRGSVEANASAVATPGDFDTDGDVDVIDFARFQTCFTGAGPTELSVICTFFDIEPDADVDLDDYAVFQGAFSGVGDNEVNKWALWTKGTRLRGANIYQRRVYPELDGDTYMGPGPVGPPFIQSDFDALAAMGANYVNISHPGLFTENAPFVLDEDIQNNLDSLLDMIAVADMFAVITFRTGPGRSDFTFYWGEVGDWFDESYLNDTMWQDAEAQEAWAQMWRYTAQRYRNNPMVVGYDLMCEPNSNEVGSHALNDQLNLEDSSNPAEFYEQYRGTLYDWNQLYPRITNAIRGVDTDTPILIGGMGYSSIAWLPYLEPTGDLHTVYAVHQYNPFEYTHQPSTDQERTYPGSFDLDWDGIPDQFDRVWLEVLLSTIDTFAATHSVPVAVNEFGLYRFQPGAAEYMNDLMDLFEVRGMNHALWEWNTSWEPLASDNDDFDIRHGPDPSNHTNVQSSDLMNTIIDFWQRNTLRP